MALADDITGDLADLFDTDEFAKAATYTPSGGQAKSIKVILDNAYAEASPGDAAVESSRPIAMAIKTDLTGTVHNGTLLVDGTTYTILEVHDDTDVNGQHSPGVTTLVLEE